MLRALVMLTLMGNAMAADPLQDAQARFQALDSYRVTLRSSAADGQQQVIRYAWQQPGWVRMDFVEPHGGMVMVYEPGSHKLRLWPFGPAYGPAFSFAPDNPLLRARHGHRIDRSDVGALLDNLQTLRANGSLVPLGESRVGTHAVTALEVRGNPGASVAGVHRLRVWLGRDTAFPLKVESYDTRDRLIETVDMADAELNVSFPPDFFTP